MTPTETNNVIQPQDADRAAKDIPDVSRTEADWRVQLGPKAYAVLRSGVMEAPHSSRLLPETRSGEYRCKGCGLALYRSEQRVETDTGWLAFKFAMPESTVLTRGEFSSDLSRIDVQCAGCGGFLGYLQGDVAPTPDDADIVNGISLTFRPD